MKESALVKKLKDTLASRGYWVMKIHGSPMQIAGVPDLLAIKDGRAVWIEAKTAEGVVSKLQEYTMTKLRAAGCVCIVARSVNDLETL